MGFSRSFGAFLTGNLIEPLVRLGEWDEAERLGRETLAGGLTGVFAASLHELLGYLAASSGRLDEALGHVREARRQLGASREPQFTQALAYIEAEVARARGDFAAAGSLVAGGLAETSAWSTRYAWPLVWLGARIEADGATSARDRHVVDATPASPTTSVLPGPAVVLSPAAAAYRALTAAEIFAGMVGRRGPPGVRRSMPGPRPGTWPLAYARFRLGDALCAEGSRTEAAAPLTEAARTARLLGATPCWTTSSRSPAARGSRSRTRRRACPRRPGRCRSG